MAKTQRNPFEFGGELAPGQLVDREDELATVIRTIENGGKLFLIGPRRYGKTSILAAAEERLEADKAIIIRHDAETYASLQLLAEGILADAAKKLTGSLEKAGETVKKIFSHLRPEVNYNFAEHKISVSLGAPRDAHHELPLLTDVLNTVDRLAAEQKHPVGVIIDEFQQVILEGGATAERQIRSVVQRHHHTAYVFAGSKTRLLADMTNDPARAFWKLGTRYFIGPIPRERFLPFLRAGFIDSGFRADEAALVQILDLAEDVPYNVQQLANMCWEMVRVDTGHRLTPEVTARALAQVVTRENSPYTQLWNTLTRAQKSVLLAVVLEKGVNLRSAAVTARYAVPLSTMQRTLQSLDDKGIIREEETLGSIRFRTEDPFFGHWLRELQSD